ncbi:unnamed protein product [Schistosoma margrebowiei]|uniref:Uncharacterized protein n=1 Tax=Schistosoma margrebowiei TaxID=48269 RepID=A0A183L9S9_9TREM|nr:unnamed protein product [Schistosoma margrebowiei]
MRCSSALLSDPSHSNYPTTSSGIQDHREINVSNESISDQTFNAVISDADYLNDSLVSIEVFSEFKKSILNDSRSGDIITNFACSHNIFVFSENLNRYEAQILNGFKSEYRSDRLITNVNFPHNPFISSHSEKKV